MFVLPEETLGDVVRRNFYASEIFDSYDINYCCEGGLSIIEACRVKNIESEIILTALDELSEQEDEASSAFSNWPLNLLVDYIRKKHHRYITFNIPEIWRLLEKFFPADANVKYPQRKTHDHFRIFEKELNAHIKKEQQLIFLYIKKLVLLDKKAFQDKSFLSKNDLDDWIEHSFEEHEKEGKQFKLIYELISDYNQDDEGYSRVLKEIQEFEKDLHRHVHLENNLLFPKAKALQQKLRRRYHV